MLMTLQPQMSDKNQVTLENLNLSSAGQYRCEISAEAPLFNTVAQSKKMNVIGENCDHKKHLCLV